MNKKLKIIVLGGTGFIGSNLVKGLKDDYSQVFFSGFSKKSKDKRYINLDLTSEKSCLTKLKGFDVVINAAALDGNYLYKKKYPLKIFETNTSITRNILHACFKNGISRVILLSSVKIYPQIKQIKKFKEEDDYRKYPDFILDSYILCKRFSEILSMLYEQKYGRRILNLRLCSVFGPDRLFFEKSTIIAKMIKILSSNKSFKILANEKSRYNFLYINDLVNAIKTLLKRRHNPPFVNIAPSVSISLRQLVALIAQNLNCKNKICFDNKLAIDNQILDNSLLKSLGFKESDFMKSLKETIDYFTNYVKTNN